MRIAAVLLVAGCSPFAAPLPVPGGWTGDPALWLTPAIVAELPTVADAFVAQADRYCRAGHRCIRVRVGRGTNEVRLTDSIDDIETDEGDRTVALTQSHADRRNIYFFRHWPDGVAISFDGVCDGDDTFDANAIVAHELGHFLGFPHVDDPSSVMFPMATCDADLRLP